MNHQSPELTEREIALLKAVAQGKSNTQIANDLSLAQQTVKNSLSRLYARLGVRTRTEAAMWAVEHGVLQDSVPLSHLHRSTAPASPSRDFPQEKVKTMPATDPFTRPQSAAQARPPSQRRRSWRKRSAFIVSLFTLTVVAALFWATTATYGRSTVAFPVSTGKVEAVEAFLRARYGDDVEHWVEAIEVTYADGSVRLEPKAFFTFPSSLIPLANGEVTDIVTGREGSGPYRREFWKRLFQPAPPSAQEIALTGADLPAGSRVIAEGYTSIADSAHPLHVRDLPDSAGLARMEETPFLYNYKTIYRFSAFSSDPVAMVGNFVYTFAVPTDARTALNHFEQQILDGGAEYLGDGVTSKHVAGALYHLVGSENDHLYWFIGTAQTHLYLAMANGLDHNPNQTALLMALDVTLN